MIFHVTQKLAKKLHLPPLQQPSVQADAFGCWYANVVLAGRVQYILTVNGATLFSVVTLGRGITDQDSYLRVFQASLFMQMEALGLRDCFSRYFRPQFDTVEFAKTLDRSVLGSMNDMRYQVDFLATERQYSPIEIAAQINKTPFGALKYQYSVEVFIAIMTGN